MSLLALRASARQARELLQRAPLPSPATPRAQQIAWSYLSRVGTIAELIELVAVARFNFEAGGLVRPLFEMFLKLAYITQENLTDRLVAARDVAAQHVWNHERGQDGAMIAHASAQVPGHFPEKFLADVAAARGEAKQQGTNGHSHLGHFAAAAGLDAEYRTWHGTLSLPAHGSVNASTFSALPVTDEQIQATLSLGARYALKVVHLAAQLLDDQVAVSSAEELLQKP